MRYLVLKFGSLRSFWLAFVSWMNPHQLQAFRFSFVRSVFSDTSVGFPNIVAKSLGEEIESRILNHRNPLTYRRGLCVRQVYLVLWNEVCVFLYPFEQALCGIWHIQASHTQASLEHDFVRWYPQAVC